MKKLIFLLFILPSFVSFSFINSKKDTLKSKKACVCWLVFHNITHNTISKIYLNSGGIQYNGTASAGGTWTSGTFEGCGHPTNLSWTCSPNTQYSYIWTTGDGALSTCHHYTGTTSSIAIPNPPPGQIDFYITQGTTCITPP